MTTLAFVIFFTTVLLLMTMQYACSIGHIRRLETPDFYPITVTLYYRCAPLYSYNMLQSAPNGNETTLPTLAFLSRHCCYFTCVFSHDPETMTTLDFSYIYQIIIAVIVRGWRSVKLR
jgi:hypothetical protein